MLLTARVRAADVHLIVSSEASQDLDRAIEILRSKGTAGSELLVDALVNRDRLEASYGVPAFPAPERRLQILNEAFELATRHFGDGSRQQLKVVPQLAGLKLIREGPAELQRFFESSLALAAARPDGVSSSFEYFDASSSYGLKSLHDRSQCRRSFDTACLACRNPSCARTEQLPLESVLVALSRCFFSIGDPTGYRYIEDAFEVAAARERPPSTNLLRRAESALYMMDRIPDFEAGERYYQHAIVNSHAIPEPALREKIMTGVMMTRVCLLASRGDDDGAEAVAAPLVAHYDAEFRRIGVITANQGDLWLCLSAAQRQNGRFVEAAETAQKMVDRCRATNAKFSSNPITAVIGWDFFSPARCQGRALAARALAELAQGRAADALATVEERLQVSKEFSRDRRFAVAYGRALLANGRADEAIEPLRINYGAWLSLAPNSIGTVEAQYWFGQAYLAIGDKRGEWMVAEAKQKLAASPIKTHRAIAAKTTSATKSAAVSK